MVAITRTAAAGIAVLSALKGAAASTETRDVFDDVAALDARDVLNEGAEPLALDARDFDDELYYETRDFDDDLEKRFFLTKAIGKVVGGAARLIGGRKGRRSLDDGEDLLEGRGIEEDVVAFDTRDLGDDVPLEARAILEGSHPDVVVVNKRFFRKLGRIAKGLLGRDFDDEDLDVRDFDDYEVSFEARDEEESTSEGPSGDAPSPSRKGKGRKGKGRKSKGKSLIKSKSIKGPKSKSSKKAGSRKRPSRKGARSGKKSGKGTRSVDGGEFYEA